MTTPLELSARRDASGATVLTAAGEIDMSNAAGFRDALSQAGADGAAFTVDLTGVGYLDSAGLTALLPYAARVRIIATAVLAPVLSVTGLDPITTVVSASLALALGGRPGPDRPLRPGARCRRAGCGRGGALERRRRRRAGGRSPPWR